VITPVQVAQQRDELVLEQAPLLAWGRARRRRRRRAAGADVHELDGVAQRPLHRGHGDAAAEAEAALRRSSRRRRRSGGHGGTAHQNSARGHTRPPSLSLRLRPSMGGSNGGGALVCDWLSPPAPPRPAPPWRWAAATLRCPGAPTCTAAVSRCAVGRPWTATSSVCSAVETSATVDACASPPPTGVRSSSTSCEAGGDSQSHEMTTGRGGHPGHSHSR
jgi:hypothetical protein